MKKKDTKSSQSSSNDILLLLEKKMVFFQDVMQKTAVHVQNNKLLNILGVGEVNNCISILYELSSKLKEIHELHANSKDKTDNIINVLQHINNELSALFKLFGTQMFEDFLWICFGNNSVNTYAISDMDKQKFELLKKHFHPTGYKVLSGSGANLQKKEAKNEDDLNEKSKNLDMIDLSYKIKPFYLKVHGVQIVVHNLQHKKSLLISGYIDDVCVHLLNNGLISSKFQTIKENIPNSLEFKDDTFARFIDSLTLKDYLIYDPHEIYSKYVGCLSSLNAMYQKTTSQIIKDFVTSDLFVRRLMLIQLLTKSGKLDNQYLAYLLYDLLSNDANGTADSQEQNALFDSLPWSIKQGFREAMKTTNQYTHELSNFDLQKIPLEQQICLLKAPDSVKEKAMQKLKEIKAKSEDTGSKARQYLDGLLKIPFNIYRKEPVLNLMTDIRLKYVNALKRLKPELNEKTNYTSLEVLKGISELKKTNSSSMSLETIKNKIEKWDKQQLTNCIANINCVEICNKSKIKISNKKKSDLVNDVVDFFNKHKEDCNELFDTYFSCQEQQNKMKENDRIISEIETKYGEINQCMSNVKQILDKAVYGHDKAKKQIERIIGQWINGDTNTGHILGFEGNPGIGKTSLAKGLAKCLKDANGESRPFSVIMMGGDSNGSHLVGHSYTYVGSTWGQIVQILIDNKCMNPIILIDEVDKISRTEHGKEIVGILTHLLDATQNEHFQDKYFSGIDLDLSKALFILSYNDADLIDRILLDRVHRIKFESLSIDDKVVISKNYLLPDICKNVGLVDMVTFSDETLRCIIEDYTLEPGVRKLKETLFNIVAELNLNILKNKEEFLHIPIEITCDDVRNKYLPDKHRVRIPKIHDTSVCHMINGMWANQLSQGGILQFQACFSPAPSFLEIVLTGNQKEVMREGMIISRNIAWNLTPYERQKELIQKYNDPKNNCVYGINIHAGDLSVPKDGPSASSTIVVLFYALFNNIKIKNYFAMTGEITLDGKIKEIGGLSSKILGSIKNGVKEFIFPSENNRDFEKFMEKYKDNNVIEGIKFHSADTIDDVFKLIFEV